MAMDDFWHIQRALRCFYGRFIPRLPICELPAVKPNQTKPSKPFTHIFLEYLPYLNWEDFEVFLGGIFTSAAGPWPAFSQTKPSHSNHSPPLNALERHRGVFMGDFYLGCRCVARLQSNQGAADEPSLTSLGNQFPLICFLQIPRIQRTILRQIYLLWHPRHS